MRFSIHSHNIVLITQERLGQIWVPWAIYNKKHILFFSKVHVYKSDIEPKTLIFDQGCTVIFPTNIETCYCYSVCEVTRDCFYTSDKVGSILFPSTHTIRIYPHNFWYLTCLRIKTVAQHSNIIWITNHKLTYL